MMFKENIQKDIDVLELMDLKISRYFDNKNLYIGELIYNLESYLNQLVTVDEQWKTDFRTIWFDIEIIYALVLDQDLELFTNEDKLMVENSLRTLKKMAQDKLNDLKIGLR